MTINEFKHSDAYTCIKVGGELMYSMGRFIVQFTKAILKGFAWIGKKTYRYVMK